MDQTSSPDFQVSIVYLQSGGQQALTCRSNLAYHLIRNVLLEPRPPPFSSMLSLAAFVLQGHSCVLARDITCPTKPKILTLWPFTEKVCQLLS